MALIRWNPTRDLPGFPSELWNVQREFDRLFGSLMRGGIQDDGTFGVSVWTPPVDIYEQENEYVVKAELPGMSKDDVKITLESNVLTIQGEKKEEKEDRGEDFRRMERTYGSFQRSFTLPTSVKSDLIDATYKNGVLMITLPKAEEAKPKQIEVKVKN
ncbi:MAG: Hsp20/alpha crystallin family protein [Ignavibacteriales bacterium]|nr:Hsp20/alpha crystallin family protein [Ignavibacteriales bacterium]